MIDITPDTGTTGNQRRGNHDAAVVSSRHLTLNAVPASSGLVSNVELDPWSAELAEQLRQRRRRVDDFPMLAHLSAIAVLRY